MTSKPKKLQPIIHKHQSKMMDFIWSPNFLYADYSDVDMTSSEREKMADTLEVVNLLRQILESYRADIEKYFRRKNSGSFVEYLYHYLLENGQDPKTMEEFYQALKSIPLTKLQEIYIQLLTDHEKTELTDSEFLELVDQLSSSDEQKWRFTWNYYHLAETVQGMIELYQNIIPLYEPYYAQFEAEIDDFLVDVDIENLYQESDFDLIGVIRQLNKEKLQIFVWTSLHWAMRITTKQTDPASPIYLYIYPRVGFFLNSRKSITKETLDIAIKGLGDPIRYSILKFATMTDLKNKEIAQKLGTTPANVSFHLQKLMNANVLQVDTQSSDNKFKLNKILMKDMLARIQDDFDL